MIYSKQGLALTEQFEGCRLEAYLDSGGIPTIGYGHTQNVGLGLTCTLAQAEAWLILDITWASNIVNNVVKVPLTQGQFDGLVDLTFNIGAQAFARSTLLALLNKGDYDAATAEFERWCFVNGRESDGLLRRRIAEKEEFAHDATN